MTAFLFSPAIVGIDIQPNTIRLAEVKKKRGGFLLQRLEEAGLPASIFAADKIKEWDILSACLKKMFATWKLKARVAVICLSLNEVNIQRIVIPKKKSHVLIEADIKARIQHDLGGATDAFNIDYHLVNEFEETMELFYAVTRRDYLQQYVECIARAGLKVKIVDVEGYALNRALCPALQPGTEKVYALFYTKSHQAYLMFFSHHEMIFNLSWCLSEPSTILLHLKKQLQTIMSGLNPGKTTHLYWCSDISLENENVESWPCTIVPYSLNPILICPEKIITPYKHRMLDFGLVIGMAMREVPLW